MTITVTEKRYIRARISHSHSVVGGGFEDGVLYTYPNVTLTSTKTSVEKPNWKSLVKNHQQAGTPRTIVVSRSRGGFGVAIERWWRIVNGVRVDQYVEEVGQLWSPSSQLSSPATNAAADNEARMRFYKAAKSAQTAFRSLTVVGELAETLRMLRNPGRALRRGLDDYVTAVNKRSRRAKRSSLNRIVSETWLEHVFGWQPLISDIKSGGEALNRRLNRFAGNYTRISGSGGYNTSTFSTLDQVARPYITVYYRTLTLDKVSVRYYGQIRSVCENPIEADMTLFGANWREIVPTAWELIPYSFLVDYFTNIGDVLDAWSVRASDIAWASSSTHRIRRRYVRDEFVSKGALEATVTVHGWTDRYINTSPFVNETKTIERAPHTPSLPTLRLEIPGMGTKWINMSALLGARNRTRRSLFSK